MIILKFLKTFLWQNGSFALTISVGLQLFQLLKWKAKKDFLESLQLGPLIWFDWRWSNDPFNLRMG